MKLIKGECLTEMHKMDDESIDLVICDLPYGTIDCEWDIIINPDVLFQEYERISTKTGTMVLFGAEPFSTQLRTSGKNIFKYDLIWYKNKASGFPNANYMPLRNHENISIFSKGNAHSQSKKETLMTYNPQGLIKIDKNIKLNKQNFGNVFNSRKNFKSEFIQEYTNYPKSILKFDSIGSRYHPTQKPVELYEYLIRTYSNPGDVILDNCAGGGTLGVAGLNIPDRDYIMIELEPKYQDVIIERIPDIEVIEGSQDIYKPALTVDRIIELAKKSKNGNDFKKMLMDENLDASKLLKEYKVKSLPHLRIQLRKL